MREGCGAGVATDDARQEAGAGLSRCCLATEEGEDFAGDVLTNGYGYIGTAPDHRSPGTTSPAGGQPPAPLPTGGRKDTGTPNTPGTVGIAGGSVTPPDPSPAHR